MVGSSNRLFLHSVIPSVGSSFFINYGNFAQVVPSLKEGWDWAALVSFYFPFFLLLSVSCIIFYLFLFLFVSLSVSLYLCFSYHVPGKLFGNLTVPSAGAFQMFQEMESAFLSTVESVVHCHGVCSILSDKLSSINFHLCSVDCRDRFLKMYCRIRLCWHVRFVNRNLDKVRFQSSISGLQLDKFKA